jgi:NADH-quinone oxidoreductase subunit G
VTPEAEKIAASLVSGQNAAVLLGNFSQQHPKASTLNALAQQLAGYLGAKFGFLGEAANSVGGYVAKATPVGDGLDAARMIADPRRGYLVVGAEPEADCADGHRAVAALKQAASVVVLSPYRTAQALDYADAILPISPFAETSGTFINTEGRVQSFQAANRPLGDTRPGWKVLRVLGNLFKLDGFTFESSEAVRHVALGGASEFVAGLDNGISGVGIEFPAAGGLERVADVPIYAADPLVRRAGSLQKTKDGQTPAARMNATTLAGLGLVSGDRVRVHAGGEPSVLVAQLDAGLPSNCVRVAGAHAATANIGALGGAISVEKA